MLRVGAALLSGGMLACCLFACAGAPPAVPPPPPPAPVAAPVPAPGPAIDPREERQLVKDLLRDIAEYYRLLGEKSVERAAAYAEPEKRSALQDDLWGFVARYSIESVHVQSHQLFPQPDGVMAKVRVERTLFERGSVVPSRSEVWMTWQHRGQRWTLVPQQQK